ncbi:hypothetical protein Nepgr_028863 [Nepenthes gracilis]|uniref:Uncharacterized protein n=1 Tax=Nepenthes gracilis TaxID=150966 RepID=A0AAD3TB63_NEPGR|nr:hypothetical protein Nepgr_028863 [Nepenthes gracilis]
MFVIILPIFIDYLVKFFCLITLETCCSTNKISSRPIILIVDLSTTTIAAEFSKPIVLVATIPMKSLGGIFGALFPAVALPTKSTEVTFLVLNTLVVANEKSRVRTPSEVVAPVVATPVKSTKRVP